MSFQAELTAFATDAMERLGVPGASIGILTSEGREVTPLGVTALDTGFAVRRDTIFQVGSISKPFTASLLVALSEDGLLDLDEPVAHYVPDLQLGSQSAATTVTTRQLLTHQSGFWGDWFDDFGLGNDAMERFIAEYGQLPQMFAPGSMWAYNNCGYILAGYIASRITGKTFEAALDEKIIDPLNLDHTFLSAADAIAFPVAVGHTNPDGEALPVIARLFLRPRARNPAGGVLSNVDDLLTFASLHLERHPNVISAEAVRAMHQPRAETYETDAHWGLGFRVEARRGGTIVGHGGATNGFRAELSMAPDQGLAVAVLTNSDSGSQFASEVVDWILDQRAGIRAFEHPTVDLPLNEAANYVGTFAHPYGSLEVMAEGWELSARLTTSSPYSETSEPQTGAWFGLRHIGADRFLISDGALEGAQMKFWRNDDGAMRFLQAGGRLYVPGSWGNLKEID